MKKLTKNELEKMNGSGNPMTDKMLAEILAQRAALEGLRHPPGGNPPIKTVELRRESSNNPDDWHNY